MGICILQVQEGDSIVLESVKSPGQYLHSSAPYQIDNFHDKGWDGKFLFFHIIEFDLQ